MPDTGVPDATADAVSVREFAALRQLSKVTLAALIGRNAGMTLETVLPVAELDELVDEALHGGV